MLFTLWLEMAFYVIKVQIYSFLSVMLFLVLFLVTCFVK